MSCQCLPLITVLIRGVSVGARKSSDSFIYFSYSIKHLAHIFVSVYAWAILPSEFIADFGTYYFRPWRLLCIVYSCMYIIPAVLLSFGPESPKFLLSQGRHDEAMEVLRTMYAANKGKSPADFPVSIYHGYCKYQHQLQYMLI